MNHSETARAPIIAPESAGFLNQAILPAIIEMEILKRKEYLTEEEAAKLYSLPAATLRTDRCRGRGPCFVKKGRKVLYKKVSLTPTWSAALSRLTTRLTRRMPDY